MLAVNLVTWSDSVAKGPWCKVVVGVDIPAIGTEVDIVIADVEDPVFRGIAGFFFLSFCSNFHTLYLVAYLYLSIHFFPNTATWHLWHHVLCHILICN